MRTLLTAALLVFLDLPAFSQGASSGQKLSAIRIEGLTTTKDDVVLRELELKSGDVITPAAAKEAVQRVRNMGIFTDVDGAVDDNGVFRITLKERWTLIPIAKFASGGGVNQFIFGVFNSNLLGMYREAGAQYERLGEADSGVIWYKDPWFAGNRYGIDLQLWNTNRLRTKYEPRATTPVIKTGFLQTRRKAYLAVPKQITDRIELKPFIEYNNDEFSIRYLTPEVEAKVTATGLPPQTEVILYGLQASFGKINYNNWLQDGISLQLVPKFADVRTPGLKDFYVASSNFLYFRTVLGDHTFACRAATGSTDTEVLQYWNYFGGLGDIRGFADNRFAGRAYWLANSEWRLPFYRTDQVVLQQVTFFDSVATSEDYSQLTSASGTSIGLGVRLIAPKIYRLVARLDIAKPVVRKDEMPVSFGVQQFF